MTDNMTPFPVKPEEPQIWVCRCGCQSFRIQSNDTIECCNCRIVSDCEHGDWRKTLPPSEPTEETNEGATNVTALGHADIARSQVFRAISEWHKSGDIAMLAAYNTNGTGRYWLAIETKEQKKWILARIRDMAEFTEKTNV